MCVHCIALGVVQCIGGVASVHKGRSRGAEVAVHWVDAVSAWGGNIMICVGGYHQCVARSVGQELLDTWTNKNYRQHRENLPITHQKISLL